MDHIVQIPLPTHSMMAEAGFDGVEDITLFCEEKLFQTVKSLGNKKAPVFDGIPGQVLKSLVI